MFHWISRLFALVLLVCLTTPTIAQDDPPPIGNSARPPFDDGLLRLSEILGAMHYLRQICGDRGALWRDQMQDLLSAEDPDPERRARLIDRFNRGYDSFGSVYRNCTPAAALVIDRYLEEGARIARDIAARYGKEP